MISRNRTLVPRTWTLGAAILVAVGALGTMAAVHQAARGEVSPNPTCVVATVGATPVTVRDAQILRAFIAPPPTLGEAARLAVQITQDLDGRGEAGPMPPEITERFARRRALMVHGTSPTGTHRPVTPGPCGHLLHTPVSHEPSSAEAPPRPPRNPT